MSSYGGERQYLDLLRDLLDFGDLRHDRTGVGTRSLFGRQMRFELWRGFPLLTTKRVHWKSVVVELLWMLRGDTNVAFLHEHGVTIWDEWADKNGDLGPVYGKQWRSWPDLTRGHDWVYDGRDEVRVDTVEDCPIDQIKRLIDGLKIDPYGRRHVVSAWNVAQIDDMALPPCHCLFQFYVDGSGRLSCQLYQRSADIFLGVPFNIASYALLTHIVARAIGREVGEFIHTFGDVHLYLNHVDQVVTQLDRGPRPPPTLVFATSNVDPFAYKPEQFLLSGYDPHPAIKAPVAV